MLLEGDARDIFAPPKRVTFSGINRFPGQRTQDASLSKTDTEPRNRQGADANRFILKKVRVHGAVYQKTNIFYYLCIF